MAELKDFHYESPALERYVNGTRPFLNYFTQLRSEKGKKLLAALQERPGLNIDELAQALGVRRTAAKHHLRRLERDHVVVRIRQGRHVLHFPSSMNPTQRTAFTVLRVPSIRAVLLDLFSNASHSKAHIAQRLRVSTRTVRRALRKLEQQGLARVQLPLGGGADLVHLHPEMRIALARSTHLDQVGAHDDAVTESAQPPAQFPSLTRH